MVIVTQSTMLEGTVEQCPPPQPITATQQPFSNPSQYGRRSVAQNGRLGGHTRRSHELSQNGKPDVSQVIN